MPPNNRSSVQTVSSQPESPRNATEANGAFKVTSDPGDERLLCSYDTRVFDLSGFYANHPGGKQVIELSKNTDITHLYNSYHWGATLTQQAKNKSFNIREVTGKELEALQKANGEINANEDTETDDSIIRLQKHLIKRGYYSKNLKTPWWGWLYFAVGLSGYLYCGAQWYCAPTVNMQYAYGALFGLLGFFVCGFIQHEGSHNAISNNKWVNRMGACMLLPWGHPEVWMFKHVIEHHPNTNTLMDEDIQLEGSILRHHHLNKLSLFHRVQAFSINVLSIFVSLSHPMNFELWAKYKQTSLIYLGSLLGVFGTHYLLNGSFFLAYVPIAMFGLVFVFITQLSHIQEACIDQEKLLAKPPNFTKHQIKSCFDYDHDSLLISAISIFLNFQTYHHLLPGISHFHFLDKTFVSVINEFLEESGEKVEISTFGKVVKGYFQYMARLQSDEHFKTKAE